MDKIKSKCEKLDYKNKVLRYPSNSTVRSKEQKETGSAKPFGARGSKFCLCYTFGLQRQWRLVRGWSIYH